ncbi:hypothetical protein [Glutamicibacter sp. NPDC090743]|uniref:hypothetical protein n=1 Tax=Glutamicibacter sp. NPDC090743 TaxID=3364001 RepID=UPI0037F4DE2C
MKLLTAVSMVSVFSPRATRARGADWVELSVLIEGRPMTNGRIISAQRILSEPGDDLEIIDQDDLDDGIGIDFDNDPSVSDNVSEEKCQLILEELESRSQLLGDLYPFSIVSKNSGWSLEMKERISPEISGAHKCYLACLLMTCARSELLNFDRTSSVVQGIGNAFQALAYISAAELLGGKAFWMGFPRPDRSNMLDAVRNLSDQMGLGIPVDQRPPSVGSTNSVKDGGIDLIAWRTFKDGRPSGIVLYGQVASGDDWQEKSVNGNIGKFKAFFKSAPAAHPLIAIFIPRVANDGIGEDNVYSYEDRVSASISSLDGELGLIVDRLRLTELTGQFGRSASYEYKDIQYCIRKIVEWSVKAIKQARE